MEKILFVILIVLVRKTIGKKCSSNKLKDERKFINDISTGEYVCPSQDDPPSHTECCWDDVCCPPLADTQGDAVLKMICIVVITACLVVVIALLIGCFWGRGMCYQCCRHKYNESDVAKYSLADGSLRLMPIERTGNSHDLSGVRVRSLEEV